MGNWDDKNALTDKAITHTAEMQKLCNASILEADASTIIYNPNFKTHDRIERESMIYALENIDSVGAIFKYHSPNERIAVLNFASYKNAGGMFLEGSKAQEECLCHESFLYNVLSRFRERYYDWNCANKNRALYLNRALYTPNIIFMRNNLAVKCDVITCAAPNKTAARKYLNVSIAENSSVLQKRIRFVLDIAYHNQVSTLILGAYGCGVFGQDATEVATIFKTLLDTEYKCFKTVVIAIPNGKDGNYTKFQNVFAQSL